LNVADELNDPKDLNKSLDLITEKLLNESDPDKIANIINEQAETGSVFQEKKKDPVCEVFELKNKCNKLEAKMKELSSVLNELNRNKSKLSQDNNY